MHGFVIKGITCYKHHLSSLLSIMYNAITRFSTFIMLDSFIESIFLDYGISINNKNSVEITTSFFVISIIVSIP